MARQLLFSVTSGDLIFQTFTVSGAGGQGRDHVNSGVRFIHPDSGARGESREFREQGRNKHAALVKLSQTPRFKLWVAQRINQIDGIQSAEEWVEQAMLRTNDFLVEVKDENGKWVVDHPGPERETK